MELYCNRLFLYTYNEARYAKSSILDPRSYRMFPHPSSKISCCCNWQFASFSPSVSPSFSIYTVGMRTSPAAYHSIITVTQYLAVVQREERKKLKMNPYHPKPSRSVKRTCNNQTFRSASWGLLNLYA